MNPILLRALARLRRATGVRQRKLSLAVLALLTACNCDFTTTRPLEDDTYNTLWATYGAEPLPIDTCNPLCGVGDTGDTGNTGSYPYSSGRYTVERCSLVKIDWQVSGVKCDLNKTQCGFY